jgi:serine/threonine-protein kinase
MKADILRKKFFEGVSRYEWIETLGQGGVGIVYKARDLELDEVVAIKVLSPDLAKDDEAVLTRFKREINLNRKIKHPNVARMYDFGISGSYPYITMEFVPGKDLWTLIRDERRIEPARAVPILRQIARGCSAIHELGIVHRDLKSQNVIVDEHGAVAIVDFGLARWNLGGGFTLDSIILGTPQYMSPEQASGRPVDARTDIYSIGIIAFEALTGQLPFTGDSPIAVAMKQINDPVRISCPGSPTFPRGSGRSS